MGLKYRIRCIFFFIVIGSCISRMALAQQDTRDAAKTYTINQCIEYALQHQPLVNRSQLGESIARTNNAISLAGWLPQVNLSGSLIHYNQLPTSFVNNYLVPGGAPVETKTGIANTFIPQVVASETLFSPQLVYAANTANLYVKAARQVTDSTKIGTVVAVSKSFYGLLLTLSQIRVLKEDTVRLRRNVSDAYHQYIGGIVDASDYEEAMIALNNSKAQLKQQFDNIMPGYAMLKQAMGFPSQQQFNIAVDSVSMLNDIAFDTTQQLAFEKRIEFQQLETAKKIQHEVATYYKLAFLPTVSAFYDYFYEYENGSFSKLFSQSYPYSYMGLSFTLPIFTGFSRLENIHKANLQEKQLDWSEVALKSEIYSEYSNALANYKSNLYNWNIQKENTTRAKNVYRIVNLQYMQGTVAYLNVIVAESNLISSQISELTSLYQLLSSKIDLEKSMGYISLKNQ